MMKQNKKQKKYLTPKVNVVSFVVEGGFGPSQKIETAKPAASTYQDVDNSYNDWGTVTNGSTL